MWLVAYTIRDNTAAGARRVRSSIHEIRLPAEAEGRLKAILARAEATAARRRRRRRSAEHDRSDVLGVVDVQGALRPIAEVRAAAVGGAATVLGALCIYLLAAPAYAQNATASSASGGP